MKRIAQLTAGQRLRHLVPELWSRGPRAGTAHSIDVVLVLILQVRVQKVKFAVTQSGSRISGISGPCSDRCGGPNRNHHWHAMWQILSQPIFKVRASSSTNALPRDRSKYTLLDSVLPAFARVCTKCPPILEQRGPRCSVLTQPALAPPRRLAATAPSVSAALNTTKSR